MSLFKFFPKQLFIVALIGFCSATTYAQRGALTGARSLDQLTREADLIVHGYVTSAKVEQHPQLRNLTTVVISMNVQETLKGTPRKSLQFRQYIWDVRDKLDAARYRKGEELLLMLGPVSKYGLTSPVGLEQGRFRVTRDSGGQLTALNGRDNVGLFRASEERARAQGIKLSTRQTELLRQERPGPLVLDELKAAIRTFAGAK